MNVFFFLKNGIKCKFINIFFLMKTDSTTHIRRWWGLTLYYYNNAVLGHGTEEKGVEELYSRFSISIVFEELYGRTYLTIYIVYIPPRVFISVHNRWKVYT